MVKCDIYQGARVNYYLHVFFHRGSPSGRSREDFSIFPEKVGLNNLFEKIYAFFIVLIPLSDLSFADISFW